MLETRPPITSRIKHRGLFEHKQLYKTVYEWFVHNNYEVYEGVYKHKVPDPRGAEDETEIKGRRRVNGYIMFEIKAYFIIYDLKEVEVIKNNVQKKMNQGRVDIMFSADIIKDYNSHFEGSAFLVKLKKFFHDFVIKQEISNIWEDEVYYRMFKLIAAVKQELEMETSDNAFVGRW